MRDLAFNDAVRRRVMRVFVSSTFRDMHAERDELVKRVFPQLRRMCEERDVFWSEVDLRWGVTDEQAAEGRVLPICLEEIEHCRPYFIGLLGERYGWVPQGYSETIVRQQPWLAEHHGRSVTELEILHGVLNDGAMHSRAFFYFRDPAYLERLSDDERQIYIERPSQEELAMLGRKAAEDQSAERRRKLAALKDRIRRSRLPLKEGYREPKELGDWVLRDLTTLIEQLFPANSRPNPLDQEQFEQQAFVRARSRIFVGRRAEIEHLDQYLNGDGPPLAIEGTAGSGKTALLAQFVRSAKNSDGQAYARGLWQQLRGAFSPSRDEPVWIYHFVDSSSSSSDWKELVKRLLGELRRRCRIRWSIPEEAEDLRAALSEWLPMAARRKRLVIVLDGVDQLNDQDRARDLVWLPREVPPQVRLICTARPGRTGNEMLQRGWQLLRLADFTQPEKLDCIVDLLRTYGKELAEEPRNLLAKSVQTGSPLFLTTVLEELRLFGEHEKLTQRIQHLLSAQTVEDLYIKVLERYEEDFTSNRPDLVRDAVTLLWGAKHGIPEAELLELLGQSGEPLPNWIWSPIHVAMRQSLIGGGGLLRLNNDDLRRAVVRRYLEQPTRRHAVHQKLADYHRQHVSNRRHVEELLWQLAQLSIRAENKHVLAQTLCDLPLLSFASEHVPNWIQEWTKGWQAVGDVGLAGKAYLSAARTFLSGNHDATVAAKSIRAAAALVHGLGFPAVAEELLAMIPASAKGAVAQDLHEELRGLSQRGRALQMQDKFAAAISIFQSGIELSRKKLGAGSPEEAFFSGSIAGVYHQQGRDQEALPLFETAIETLKRHYTDDSDDVIGLSNNLALTYVGLGRYEEAHRLYLEILGIEEQKFGRDAPEIVGALSGLASVEIKLGHYEQAVKIEQRALAIREAALGRDHPRTINIVHNLASTFGYMRLPDRAVPLYERCLEATRRMVGELHTDFATTAGSLAEAYSQLDQFDKALPLFTRAIEIFDRLAPDHPDRNTTQQNLAGMHTRAGRKETGRQLMQEVVAWKEQHLGPRHPETARSIWMLGKAWWHEGQIAEAERLMRHAYQMLTEQDTNRRERVTLLLELEQIARVRGDDGEASAFRREAEQLAAQSGLSVVNKPSGAAGNTVAPPDGPQATPEQVDHAKQGVQQLFAQIIEIARSNPEPPVFYREWLSRVVNAMAAHGAAVWTIDPLGNIQLEAEWKLPAECQPQHSDSARHFHLLRRIVGTQQVVSLFPGNWLNNAPDAVNPTPFALVLAPLHVGGVSLVVEVMQRADAKREAAPGWARFVAELCRVAMGYLQRRYADSPSADHLDCK